MTKLSYGIRYRLSILAVFTHHAEFSELTIVLSSLSLMSCCMSWDLSAQHISIAHLYLSPAVLNSSFIR